MSSAEKGQYFKINDFYSLKSNQKLHNIFSYTSHKHKGKKYKIWVLFQDLPRNNLGILKT